MMAAHSNNFIRVRLHFDYPPPAVVDCRMCWLLVDLNKCRVVADLESIIRDKFEFSRRNILNLYIEDCYLPHTESIYVVRDNDSVRVKVDCLTQVNGHSSHSDTASENCRKRRRPAEEEDGPGENGVNVEWKKKKRKKKSEESLEDNPKQTLGDESNKKSPGKKTKKKKKKAAEQNTPAATPKPAAATKKNPASVKSTKKPPVASKTQNASSSDSSSSSEEDEAPKKPAAKKPATKTQSSTPAATKAPPTTKPAQTKLRPPPSSSSDTDSSSSDDEATNVKIPPKTKPLTSVTPKSTETSISASTNCAQKPVSGESAPPCDDEEEIEFIIRKPVQQPARSVGNQSSWRGHGRGRGMFGSGDGGGGGPRGRGRGEGRGGFTRSSGNFEFSYDGAKEPTYQTDSLTNKSVVLQNGVESAPKQDYSSMPLLAAPPQVGQRIAFKLLELTESYTPEVSEYKEGKIVGFDPTTKQIELELPLNTSKVHVEPGKFDLVYQNADGSETVEYAVSRESCLTERWDALLEPRLII
ncbi:coilin [Scomber japonicus]|uniref:coilin n=1 Tax=Scomber japonicus TaxID=13676 RepID=UPI0023068E11|nr:coilin [Scomber japonicus]